MGSKDAKKILHIKEAIDKRLKEIYAEDSLEPNLKEMRTLEYIMCLVEADPNNEDYAMSCLIRMYD